MKLPFAQNWHLVMTILAMNCWSENQVAIKKEGFISVCSLEVTALSL